MVPVPVLVPVLVLVLLDSVWEVGLAGAHLLTVQGALSAVAKPPAKFFVAHEWRNHRYPLSLTRPL